MGREGGRKKGRKEGWFSKLMYFSVCLLWERGVGVSVCRRVQHRNITGKTEQAE